MKPAAAGLLAQERKRKSSNLRRCKLDAMWQADRDWEA
jgi:hypothetical protein